jgi:DNA integrity scanning protein DisA with diadenylate cyclase activity
MSRRRTGPLIAIERDVGLKNYIESGMMIDAKSQRGATCSVFLTRIRRPMTGP